MFVSSCIVNSIIGQSQSEQLEEYEDYEESELDSIVRRPSTYTIPNYRLGFSPTAILNTFPAIQISHDWRLNKFTEISLETAFIYTSGDFAKGFRLRPSIEMYLLRDRVLGLFVGTAISSVNVWEYLEYSVIFEEAYLREFQIWRRKNLIGYYLTSGVKMNISNKAFLEFSGGLGFAQVYNERLPFVETFFQNGFLPSRNGWSNTLGFYTNLNISFPLDVEFNPTKKSTYPKIGENKNSKSKSSKSKKRKKSKKRRN